MRHNAWEVLGLPVQSDMALDMESSHGTIERTVGVIRNIPFRFGDITVFLEVHVTKHLPCELLLGRPFFRLTSAKTLNHLDRSQEIVIRDPNTHREVTLATYKKKQFPRPKDF
jgi:hypothetical protein